MKPKTKRQRKQEEPELISFDVIVAWQLNEVDISGYSKVYDGWYCKNKFVKYYESQKERDQRLGWI